MNLLYQKEICVYEGLSDLENLEIKTLLEKNQIGNLNYFAKDEKSCHKDWYQLLTKYSNLTCLNFNHRNHTTDKFVLIENLIVNNPLKSLTITLGADEKEIFQFIEETTNLELLIVNTGSYLTDYSLKSLGNIIKKNPNLHTLFLKQQIKEDRSKFNEFYDFTPFISNLKYNTSIKVLKIHQGRYIKDPSFLQRFSALEKLEIDMKGVNLSELIESLTRDTHNHLRSITCGFPYINSVIDFSKTNITSINMIIYNFKDLGYLLKSVLTQKNMKELIFYIKEEKNSADIDWNDLKEVLVQSTKLTFLELHFTMRKNELEILLEGLEKNNSLETFSFLSKNFYNLEKMFGKVLGSKKNLKKLIFGKSRQDDFKISDFMLYFQEIQSLNTLNIKGSKWDTETSSLLSSLILNNKNLQKFDVENMENENDLKMICKSMENHTSLKNVTFYINQKSKGKPLLNMIQSIPSLEIIYSRNVEFEKEDVENFLKYLMTNQTLKSCLLITFKKYKELLKEYLIYNFDLIDFQLGGISPYIERNSLFVKIDYKFHPFLKDTNIYFE